MDKNTELLNYIYQNSEMGVDTIKQLIGIVEDNDFNKHLHAQLKEYENINKTAFQKIKEQGHD